MSPVAEHETQRIRGTNGDGNSAIPASIPTATEQRALEQFQQAWKIMRDRPNEAGKTLLKLSRDKHFPYRFFANELHVLTLARGGRGKFEREMDEFIDELEAKKGEEIPWALAIIDFGYATVHQFEELGALDDEFSEKLEEARLIAEKSFRFGDAGRAVLVQSAIARGEGRDSEADSLKRYSEVLIALGEQERIFTRPGRLSLRAPIRLTKSVAGWTWDAFTDLGDRVIDRTPIVSSRTAR